MNRRSTAIGLALLFVSAVAAETATAAPIVGGTTRFQPVTAIQDIELLPNTPFNPTGSSIFLPNLTAIGQYTFTREAQSAVGADIALVGESSFFLGFHPLLGPFELGAGPPLNIGSFAGTITNVVQDPSDTTGNPSSFISGDVSFDVTFGFRIVALGVELFTVDPVTFTGTITDLERPGAGTLLTSSGPVTAFYFDPTSGQDIAVAVSTNRRLLSVPEPASALLLGLGVLASARLRRARRPA